MRQLATRLSIRGYDTLRFDYFGTGDSGGEASQTDLVGCESDLEAAIETVKDIAGTQRVALIGLRVGANIAARVAARLPDEVAALVLWDPIVSGKEYVRSLQSPGASEMLNDLRGLDLVPMMGALPERTLILVTASAEAHQQAAQAAGARPGCVEFLPAPCPWIESATSTGVLPVKAMQRIEEWLP
jgi:pimeloyl-ACP methyl ester carboxylesterase